jgi:ankyrin repeat protein
MPLDNCLLPWVTREGITLVGERLLTEGLQRHDIGLKDSFGNTVLHFLAARGSIGVLEYALRSDFCKSLIGAKNSAGQTFLHVLNPSILENPAYVADLLDIVSERGCDIQARDHYGRSFFHLIQAGDYSDDLIQLAATSCTRDFYAARDAFGFTPVSNDAIVHMDIDAGEPALQNPFSPTFPVDPGLAKESRLLKTVRLAMENPQLQDEEGRNGLHCLAMATLSKASVAKKYHLQPPQRDKVSKKPPKSDKEQKSEKALDSSKEKLTLRQELLLGLLVAGVDPNHHDQNGNTPLMTFVAELPEDDSYKLPPAILTLLIKRGANVHARNRRGETALHIAMRCGRKLAIRALCRNGANVHARDSAGRSVLDVADVKMMNCESDEHMRDYAHYEACRAWVSGKGLAVQWPSVLDEWGS